MKLFSTNKLEPMVPLLLFFVTVLTRIPFAGRLLYHIDSVQYALALDHYDIRLHQPHPPGYFLYILLGRLVRPVVDDPNRVFVTLSVLFTAGCVVVVYLLARDMFGVRCALLAAILAITSPNLWFHGAVALNYGLESFFSAAIAYLCWKIIAEKKYGAWLALAIILALSGGVRQNTPVFLLPLVIYSCRRLPLRLLLLGGITFSCVALAWFVPMIHATGGWAAYGSAFRELWHFNTGHNSVFEQGAGMLLVYAYTLLNFTTCGIGAGVVVLPFCGYIMLRRGRVGQIDKEKQLFFTIWIAPAFLFYLLIFIHPANPGYALVFTPPLYILLPKGVEFLHRELSPLLAWNWNLIIAVVLVTVNLYLFLFSTYPISAPVIRKHDRDLALMLKHLSTFDPATTALFVGGYVFYGFRHVMYYLPEYTAYEAEYTVAPDGQVREFLGGKRRQTFRMKTIELPREIKRFATLVYTDREHKRAVDTSDLSGIRVDVVLPKTYVASGDILLVNRLYPKLPLTFGGSVP
ncbi:DUF2723 domain-containing protein [Oryzomonas sagensis]|uniref:DUF2723 domain-containing protein n=1 Tax=Oryzomonas sagensis TaxID=2603857 RepID=A0ABQ6TKR0_9BACT|nr:DUF2723 domain-containing protein [Oryzomonas sagensis]KAB0668553.1 DUF2723 domain-containing protein [Oryzomonas sagensis]